MNNRFSNNFDNFAPSDFNDGDSVLVQTKSYGNVFGFLFSLEHQTINKKNIEKTFAGRKKRPLLSFFRGDRYIYNFWCVTLLEPHGELLNIFENKSKNKLILLNDPKNILTTRIVLFEKTKSFDNKNLFYLNEILCP